MCGGVRSLRQSKGISTVPQPTLEGKSRLFSARAASTRPSGIGAQLTPRALATGRALGYASGMATHDGRGKGGRFVKGNRASALSRGGRPSPGKLGDVEQRARLRYRSALVKAGSAADVRRIYRELVELATGRGGGEGVKASDRIAAGRLLLEYLVGKPDRDGPGRPGGSKPRAAGPVLVFRGPAVVQAAPIDGAAAVPTSSVQVAPIAELAAADVEPAS